MSELPDTLREALLSRPGPVCLAVEVNHQAAMLVKAAKRRFMADWPLGQGGKP